MIVRLQEARRMPRLTGTKEQRAFVETSCGFGRWRVLGGRRPAIVEGGRQADRIIKAQTPKKWMRQSCESLYVTIIGPSAVLSAFAMYSLRVRSTGTLPVQYLALLKPSRERSQRPKR
jgi:hypothetical protein